MSTDENPLNLKRRMREASEEDRAVLIAQLPYEVGFGKPPKHTQFRPGQSGNRKGRRKGSLNMLTIVQNELEQEVEVREGGRHCRMSKLQIGMRQLANRAASGDNHELGAELPRFATHQVGSCWPYPDAKPIAQAVTSTESNSPRTRLGAPRQCLLAALDRGASCCMRDFSPLAGRGRCGVSSLSWGSCGPSAGRSTEGQ